MNRKPSTVTLTTLDHGDVTLPEPEWCAGHDTYEPVHRCDILHVSPATTLAAHGWELGDAQIYQAPCAGVGTREMRASVHLDSEPSPNGYTNEDLHSLAAALDAAAEQLRAFADRYATILAGGAE